MSQPLVTEPIRQTKTPHTYIPTIDKEEEMSEPWRCGGKMQNPLPKYDGDPWLEMYEQYAEPDRERCKAWKEEVETLLVFAGLFCAVVTAFILESYKSLKEDAGDSSAALLLRIALKLEGNNTAATPIVPFTPSKTSVRINTFWFLSLILGLATVLIGTVCLQWIREHQRLPTNAREAMAHLNMQTESLERWFVPQILNTLPLLLQMGLILFFVGIFDFLWDLHHTVAAVAMGAIGSTLVFYVITTILPALQDFTLGFPRHSTSISPRSPCPYRSPQAWVFLRVTTPIFTLLRKCMPKVWLWITYWSGIRVSLIEYDYSLHWYPLVDWYHYREKWLLQRDFDVFRAGHLHHIDAKRYRQNTSPTLAFYDHITAMSSTIHRSRKTGRFAPWVCLEEFIQDIALSRIPLSAMYSFTLFLTRYQEKDVAEGSDWKWTISDDEMSDAIICCLGPRNYSPPHEAQQPYWYEKNMRVLGAYVERAFSSTTSGNPGPCLYISQEIFNEYLAIDFSVPGHLLSHVLKLAQKLLVAIGNVNIDANTITEEDVRQSTLFLFTFGRAVAEHFNSEFGSQCHRNMVLTMAHIIDAVGHSKALLVTVVSYYLFGMLEKMSEDGNPLLGRAVTEAEGTLSLVKQYRERCIKETSESPTNSASERIQLLQLQSYAVDISRLGISYPFFSDVQSVAEWCGYLTGLLDFPTGDTPASPDLVEWRQILGSLEHNTKTMEYWPSFLRYSIPTHNFSKSINEGVDLSILLQTSSKTSASSLGNNQGDTHIAQPQQELEMTETAPAAVALGETTLQMAEDLQALESVVIASDK